MEFNYIWALLRRYDESQRWSPKSCQYIYSIVYLFWDPPQGLLSPDFCTTKQPCQANSLKRRYPSNKRAPALLLQQLCGLRKCVCVYSGDFMDASPTVYFQLSARKCARVCVRSDELIVALWMVIIQPPLAAVCNLLKPKQEIKRDSTRARTHKHTLAHLSLHWLPFISPYYSFSLHNLGAKLKSSSLKSTWKNGSKKKKVGSPDV